jgi:hypothetical protein
LTLAQGAGPKKEKINEAIDLAVKLLKENKWIY